MLTIGVVFDPVEKAAWWIDLKAAAREFRRSNPKSGTTFNFPKGLWNRFDSADFVSMLVPTLLGEAPNVSLERLCDWVMCDDVETHDIGVRAIRSRHYREPAAWDCLIEAFRCRPASQLTLNLPIGLAKLLGHDDLGYYSGEIPSPVRTPAVAKVLAFGEVEIAKLLSMLPDSDFERPSLGYSLMPLLGQRAESPNILAQIRDNRTHDPVVRELASDLFDWHQREPEWWAFWRRDKEHGPFRS